MSRFRTSWSPGALIACALLLASARDVHAAGEAPAEVSAEVSAEDKESARVLFGLGLGLLEKGETRLALEKFVLADKLYSTPITSLQLGKTHLELGELVEAYGAFTKVASIPLRASESEKSAEARDEAAKLATEVRPRLAELSVTIVGVSPGTPVTLSIDGRPLASPWSPEPHLVNPGEHTLLVQVSGTDPKGGARVREVTARWTLKEGQKRSIQMEVPPAVEATPEPIVVSTERAIPRVLIVPRVGFLLSGIARNSFTCEGPGCGSSEASVDLTDQSGLSFALDVLRPLFRNFRVGVSALYVPKLRLQNVATGRDFTLAPVLEGFVDLSRTVGLFGRVQGGMMIYAPIAQGVGPVTNFFALQDCCVDTETHVAFVYGFGAGLVVAVANGLALRAELLFQRTSPMVVATSHEPRSGGTADGKATLVSDRMWMLLGLEWGL